MTEEQKELLQTAEKSLDAARLLQSAGFYGFAASRAYYAMFYAAQALLEGEGLSFSKHSGAIAAFAERFARTGKLPVEFHRYLLDAMKLRHQGDYFSSEAVTADQAEEQLLRAEKFLRAAEALLLGHVPPE